MCSSALNSRGKPPVSTMSGGPAFDIEKKPRNGANLKLRHALRAGGVITSLLLNDWFKDRKWFIAHTIIQYLLWNTQYLVANPFALITSFALLGMDATNVRTVSFGILSHSSLTTTCWSATVCEEGFLESHPKILYRVEIRALAGHSKHFTFLLVFREVATLARWTGTLSSCIIVSKHRRCLSATSGK